MYNDSRMARPRAGEIRDTPLTWAVRSIRRRAGLGQIAFANLLLGRPAHSLVSRWESGQIVPSTENLLRLFRAAETPQERRPILDALRLRGIDGLVASLQPYLSSSGFDLSASSSHSIAPVGEGCNARS
jgi:transcriptional regulator with XRE-family HTH domain